MRFLKRANLAVRRDATLGSFLDQLVQIHGDRALVEEHGDGLKCTYRQAAKRVSRWAGGVEAQALPGDRVVVATGNRYELLLLSLAVAKAGCVPVPINPQMTPDEIQHVIDDSGASLVLRSPNQVDSAPPLAAAYEAEPSDLAALFYTSGTTGKPKGVELSHRSLVGQSLSGVLWPYRLRRDEAVISLPIAHIMGFATLIGLAAAGIPSYFLPSFRPTDVLDAIESRKATIFVGVPAMYRLMLEGGAADRDLRSIRVWVSGADAMPPELAHQFKTFGATVSLPLLGSHGEALFAEGYGMVELGGGVAAKISPPFLHAGLGESLGVSLPGYRMKVVDESGADADPGAVGELWISGPGLLKGYWNAPEATAAALTADGWLRTGDLARRGPLGSVLFVGREKDVIMHGGYTVYSLEVQEALETHPDVVEAAVTGLADDRMGEVPVAAIRIRSGANLSPADLDVWIRDHLAEYKVPTRFLFVDDLPRTGSNKVQKAALAALFD